MGALNTKSIFDISDVVSSELQGTDNTILLNIGDVYSSNYVRQAENWAAQWGYASRPRISDPSSGDPAAQVFSVNMNSNNIILGYRDTSQQYKYGNLSPGDNCMYSGGQARILLKNSGSISLMTTKDNSDSGSGCVIQLLPSGNINLASEFGGLSITENNINLISSKGSAISLNSDGAVIMGNTVVLNGSIVLGDSSATGVSTFASNAAANTLLTALVASFQAFCQSPQIIAFSGGTSTALGSAFAAWATAAVAPTNYSLKVKSS